MQLNLSQLFVLLNATILTASVDAKLLPTGSLATQALSESIQFSLSTTTPVPAESNTTSSYMTTGNAPENVSTTRKLTKRGTTKTFNNMELCGMKGCIITSRLPDGTPLFGGMGCDHCLDGWTPSLVNTHWVTKTTATRAPVVSASVTNPSPPQTTTMTQIPALTGVPALVTYITSTVTTTIVMTQLTTLTLTSTIFSTQLMVSTSILDAYTTKTAWTTQVASKTVTSIVTSGGKMDGCSRIGTLDDDGPLFAGKNCIGDATYDGNGGCGRVGSLDAGGALWAGQGCGKVRTK